MKRWMNLLALAALVASGTASAQEATDPVAQRVGTIVEDFTKAVKGCGVRLPPVRIAVDQSPILIAMQQDGVLHVATWKAVEPDIKAMFGPWAQSGTLGLTPEQQFGEVFNRLLVPHEMGHWVQMSDGRDTGADFWDGEVSANRTAIAFWSLTPQGAARIETEIDNYNRFLEALPNPVPPGQDPKEYFQANYEKLFQDAEAYGWYQGLFMREAWAMRGSATFCELVNPDRAGSM